MRSMNDFSCRDAAVPDSLNTSFFGADSAVAALPFSAMAKLLAQEPGVPGKPQKINCP
jgi:hypothetical protein